jgi:hypothetical protein
LPVSHASHAKSTYERPARLTSACGL